MQAPQPDRDPSLDGRPSTDRLAGRGLVSRVYRQRNTLIAFVLFGIAASVFTAATESVPFHGDESEWINNGRYFRFIFLDHDVRSSVWRPSWLNRDQPPFGRYVIGGIVWASGTDPGKVNRSWSWESDYETNLREGRVPGPSILGPVRRSMALFGAAAVVALFAAGCMLGGTLTGVVAGLVATFSPLLQSYFAQARTEALLAIFTALALLVLLAFARRYQRDGTIPRSAWTIGAILGIALATKLTAAVAIIAACTYGGFAGLSRLRAARSEAIALLAWSLATGLLASVVWVAVNPFLWPDPVGRTYSMLTQQELLMERQGVQFGNPVEAGLPGRVVLLITRTFVENSTPAYDYGAPPGSPPLIRRSFSELPAVFGVTVELALATVGFGVLLARMAKVWRSGQRHGVESVMVWWLLSYVFGIAGNLNLDWPRYYVPTAYYGSLLIGLGAASITTLAWRRLASRRGAIASRSGPAPQAVS